MLNQAEKGEEILLRTTETLDRFDDQAGIGNLLLNVGHTEVARGRLVQAARSYAQGFVAFARAGRPIDQGNAAAALGRVFALKGQIDRARRAALYYQRMADEAGVGRFRATAAGELARLLALEGRNADAAKAYSDAIELAGSSNFAPLESQLRIGRARALADADPAAAEADYRQALALLKSTRYGLRSFEDRMRFQVNPDTAYEELIGLLASDESRGVDILQAAEQARARTFADDLSRSPLRPPMEIPETLVTEEHELLTRVRRLERGGGGLPDEYQTLTDHLAGLWRRIRSLGTQAAQAYVDLREQPESATLDTLRRLITPGPSERRVVLVEYFFTRTAVVMVAAHEKNAELAVRRLPFDTHSFSRWVRATFGTRRPSAPLNLFFMDGRGREMQEHARTLVAPLNGWSEPGDLIILVPHAALHLLPLHAVEAGLLAGSAPLIARNPVAYAPSIATLGYCRARRAPSDAVHPRPAAVFGDPLDDLPFSRIEAREIAQALGVTPRLGAQATSNAFLREAVGAAVVHYSGHAAFDSDDPLNSGLRLADGILTARDVLGLSGLNAELVVLNGCETGVSETGPGDELFGLARAFLLSGAATVLVNLWPVGDRAASSLLIRFYNHWMAEPGAGKAAALRDAVLEISRQGKRPSPYVWAPFILIGDWI